MTNISKSILLAGVVLMALLCMIGTAAAAEEIDEWSDFYKIRDDPTGDFTLIANLDFSSDEAAIAYSEGYWTPLGAEDNPFTGIFDGGVYTISNLVLTEESYNEGAGFFGFVGEGATLKNVKLENVTVTIGDEQNPYAGDVYEIGLLAGNFSGTIEDSYATGNIEINSEDDVYNIGGLIGYNEGDMTNSYVTGNIEITAEGEVYSIGGLVGYNEGDMTNSYATGNITIETAGIDNVGGLIGYNEGGTITNSYTTGSIKIAADDVRGSEGDIGGLVGENYGGDIDNCYALNKEIIINGASGDYIGKATGYSDGEATDVYAWDDMEGTFTYESDESEPITSAEVWNNIDWIGDDSTWKVNDYDDFKLPVFVWQEETLVADASHLNPEGDIYVWADFDKVRNDPTGTYKLKANLDFNNALEDCWEPLGTGSGPFTGTFDGRGNTISNLVLTEESYDGAAGFFGFVGEGATLKNIKLENVTVTIGSENDFYSEELGGIGLLAGNSSGTIEDSYATGNITINSEGEMVYEIGGLVGHNLGDITGSYATGNIVITPGDDVYNIGGLAGANGDSMNVGGEITNSYATGSVKINSEDEIVYSIGGLVGYNNGVISNCYALNKEIIVNGDDDIGKAIGDSNGEENDVYAWDDMGGIFTSEYESGLITSAEVWNKVDWIGDDNTWKVNDHADFKLPVPIGQKEPTVADASHLNPFLTSGYGEIWVWSDFQKVKESPYGTFTLKDNLDFNNALETYWTPLGTKDDPFTGTFDGDVYTISNLTLSEENYDDAAGFFGFVGEGATLKNIKLENVEVTIGEEQNPYAGDVDDIGLLAGNFSGTIEDSYATGNITINSLGEAEVIGGLVGANGNEYSAGSAIIINSYADTDITIKTADAEIEFIYGFGGLVGRNYGEVTDSHATGDVTIKITDTEIEFIESFGGLVGHNDGGEVTDSYATGDIVIEITSEDEVEVNLNLVGGLVGFNNGDVTGSYATGDVRIIAFESEGHVSSVGGLVGRNNGEVTDSYVTGSIEITSDSEGEVNDIGGLVGYNERDISNCYALNKEITISGASIENIGKAVGYSEGEENDVYAWDGMEGDFTNEYESGPITSAEVWNKIDWIDDGESWKLNTYSDFKLPVFVWQEEPFVADASHLNPSPPSSNRGGGSGTGSATVVNSTTNTSGQPSTGEGFGEELGNDSNETGDSGNNSNDGGDSGNDSGDSSESGTNWTVIILVVAAVVVVAIAGGLYLYKAGKLKF